MSMVGWLRYGPFVRALANSIRLPSSALAGALLAMACSTLGACSSNLIFSSGPSPRVEDCMMLQQATPTRYVCNGKTYTAVELAQIRKGDTASH